MNIGSLDRYVAIQSASESTNAYGERVGSFSTLASVWARIIDNPGNEKLEANQEQSINKVDFIIRYRSDVDETMQISYDSKTYKIQNIREIGRNNHLIVKTLQKNEF